MGNFEITVEEAMASGCRFKKINMKRWFYLDKDTVRVTDSDVYSVSIARFIRAYLTDRDWVLHPGDKFNNKIEKLIL